MTKSKLTKKALLCSILTILLSTTMLIGTTFAWFTDTASTSVNKIQAGTLDVQLLDANGNSLEGETLSFKKSANAPDNEEILWEPGCTYELQPITIKNNGNLALKYTIKITGIQGDAKLNDAIEWTMKLDGQDYVVDSEHSLATKTSTTTASNTFTISGHMKEDAGNEYQGLSIDGIAITVYATQDTVEYDSYNNTYDTNAFDALKALYPVYASAEVTDSGAEITAETVKVSIPKDAIADDATNVSVTVNKTADVDSNFTVSSDEDVTLQQFEVKVTGIKNDNSTDITLEMFIGKGYSFANPNNLKVQHLKGDSTVENLTGSYDSSTGFVTIKTNSFSPFAVETPNVDAVVGTGADTTYYASLETAVATNSEAITILRDVTLNKPLEITKTVSLIGNNHSITLPKDNGSRVINVNDNTSKLTLSLSDLDIDAAELERGITVYGNTDVTINLNNCSIIADHYALNIANENKKVNVTAKDSTLTGYGASQVWSANTIATFENCKLIGLNKWNDGNDGANNSATIVVYESALSSKLTFKNCQIEANEQGTAKEYLLDVRTSNVEITFKGCDFFVNGTEVTGDEIKNNIYFEGEINPTLTIN
jgi:predicted ribosomally synthesized peptide with SipW-like signal peptide